MLSPGAGPTSPLTTSTEPATTALPASPATVVFDQPWAVAVVTDVATGEDFRIADLAATGNVVFVETMAIWCVSCHAQQNAAKEAMAQLEPGTVEWVAVDVETNETAEALARYRDENGFPFRYAISNAALSTALVEQFGDIVLSPPSVNVIVLGTDGRITHLRGHHSPADLVAIAVDQGA
jgi:hypothetical protein